MFIRLCLYPLRTTGDVHTIRTSQANGQPAASAGALEPPPRWPQPRPSAKAVFHFAPVAPVNVRRELQAHGDALTVRRNGVKAT